MPSLSVLISADQIRIRIAELAADIDRDLPEGPVYLVGVLKGSCFFLTDLARAMKTPARIDFVGTSSYGQSQTSSGEVKLTHDLSTPIEGRDVILVEDIVDTGVTLHYLTKLFAQRNPRSLRVAVFLDKPERRTTAVKIDYRGFEIKDQFVVGYGLDYAEDYRNLPAVHVFA
jgi:hypoxanthine phosphoribosyltransferase